MDVKLMTNSISLGSGRPFSEYVAKLQSDKAQVKTAAKKEEEGKSSGQPEAEAKLVNQPKVEEKSSGKASGKAEKGEAESSGQLDVEPLHQKGESVKPSAVTNENKKTEAEAKDAKVVEAKKELPDFIKEKIEEKKEKEGKGEDKSEKKEDKKEEKKCAETKAMEASKSMCASSTQVIKLSKMNDKTRGMLRKYFLRLYPANFVDAMLAEQ